MGATVALPLLDAMVPAMTALAQTAAKPVTRFGAVYVPNGVIPSQWFPAVEGADFAFTPTLKPLEPFRDRLLVLSGLDSVPPPPPGERQFNNHADASTRFLTDTTPGRAVRAGISVDQLVAKATARGHGAAVARDRARIGGLRGHLRFRPQLRVYGHHCVGRAGIAAADGAIAERGVRAAVRRQRQHRRRARADRGCRIATASSIRSPVKWRACVAASVRADRSKISGYLESIRDVERRIARAIAHNAEVPVVNRPADSPESFEEHAKLMFDLQLLAFQGDVTRVTTFMIGREFSGRTYPEIGVPDAHHPISHHRRDPGRMEKCAKINHYHMQLFSYFVDKMQQTPDGDGSLLDHVVMLYGAGMSEGNGHIPLNLPILLVGGGNGQIKGGRHVKAPAGTPLANLHVTLLNKLGVPTERHGNSTGAFTID